MRFFITALFVSTSVIFSAQASFSDSLTDALKQKMQYLGQSQAVISKNLANANTPGYKAMELKDPASKGGLAQGIGLATTSPMHIGGSGKSGNFKLVKQKDAYETAPNGNNVSIEEQMVKMSANSMEHQQVVNLMRKMSGLMNVARGDR